MAVVLAVADNGDGTSTVTVATTDYNQARVIVPNEMLGTADVEFLYEHASNMQVNAYKTPRVGRRDAGMRGA